MSGIGGRLLAAGSGCAASSRPLSQPAAQILFLNKWVRRCQHPPTHARTLRALPSTRAMPVVGRLTLTPACERVADDRWAAWRLSGRVRPQGGPPRRDVAARSTRREPATRQPAQASGQAARPLGVERGGCSRLRAPARLQPAARGRRRGGSAAAPRRRRTASAALRSTVTGTPGAVAKLVPAETSCGGRGPLLWRNSGQFGPHRALSRTRGDGRWWHGGPWRTKKVICVVY